MPMRIALTNPTVFSMNEKFRFLVTRNVTSDVNGFLLCFSTNCCTRVSRSFDLPATIRVRSYVLIFSLTSPPYTRGRFRRLSRLVPFASERTYFSP